MKATLPHNYAHILCTFVSKGQEWTENDANSSKTKFMRQARLWARVIKIVTSYYRNDLTQECVIFGRGCYCLIIFFCCFWNVWNIQNWIQRLDEAVPLKRPFWSCSCPIPDTMEETRALFREHLLPLVYCWKIYLLLHNVDCLMLE